MWIENIKFIGFGGIAGEQVDFASDRLNLIIEPNEYGKSTMVESIWCMLYGFPDTGGARGKDPEREDFRPWEKDSPYAAAMDLRVDERCFRIVRDFESSKVEVWERKEGEGLTDVTAEFLGPDGEDLVGVTLTGMSRDLFRNTCLVGQRHLDAHHVPDSHDVKQLLQSIADSHSPGSTASQAVATLENCINQFPYGNRKASVAAVIKDLEERRDELAARLKSMDGERQEMRHWLGEITDIDARLQGDNPDTIGYELDNLKLQIDELERKLKLLKERSQERQQLEGELSELKGMSTLDQEATRSLLELWTRRQSRKVDMDNLAAEIHPQEEEYERNEQGLNEQFEGLSGFTQEEASSISALAINLYTQQKELNELKSEAGEAGLVHTPATAPPRSALSVLDRVEVEQARSYASLLIAFDEQIRESQRKVDESEGHLKEIEDKRRSKRQQILISAVVMFIVAILLLVVVLFIKLPALITLSMYCFSALMAFLASFTVSRFINFSYMKEELDIVSNEQGRHRGAIQQGNKKLRGLEARLTEMALKAGLADREELLKVLQESTQQAQDYKEQQSVSVDLSTKEQQCKKVESDLAYYFERAGRDTATIDSQRAMDLSQDVERYLAERGKLQGQIEEIRTSRKQLDFLATELEDINESIRSILLAAGLEATGAIEELGAAIDELLEHEKQKQKLVDEIARTEYDLSGFSDIKANIEEMEAEKEALAERMKGLIAEHPHLAGRAAPDPDNPPPTVLPWGDTGIDETQAAQLKERRDELTVMIRTSANKRDETYLDTKEELAIVEHELVCTRRAKLALELARDMLKESSTKTYVDWAQELNSEAGSLIEELGGEIERLDFAPDLSISVRMAGHDDVIDSNKINSALSTGTREQVHWLARLIVSRYLSRVEALPIVLDEPFSEADDQRFKHIMEFLIDSIVAQHQLIICSCHHQRHQWLNQQLSPEQQDRLSFVARQPIARQDTAKSPI